MREVLLLVRLLFSLLVLSHQCANILVQGAISSSMLYCWGMLMLIPRCELDRQPYPC